MYNLSWHRDERCAGPFPKNFESIEKTLRNLRKSQFGKSPMSAKEIEHVFNKPEIMEGLGTSLHHEKGPIYNGIQITDKFTNCIFFSPKSITLITHNMEPHERSLLMDGTFRITPRGIFSQLLVIYVQFGIKVQI